MTELLKVNDLVTQFKTESGVVKAVDGVSYFLNEQEIIGLVGESGCGKSVSQLSVMQLISAPGEIVSGEVNFEGQNLLKFEHDCTMPSSHLHLVNYAKQRFSFVLCEVIIN